MRSRFLGDSLAGTLKFYKSCFSSFASCANTNDVQNPKRRPAAALQSPVGGAANVNVGIGNNGTYERSLVPLSPGTNLITVTASDAFGNRTNKSITLNYQPPALNQPRLPMNLGL
jgi:hypothetical protein